MSRYDRDWMKKHRRQVAAENAAELLHVTESQLARHREKIPDLELRVQQLKKQLQLKMRAEATAMALTADVLLQDHNRSKKAMKAMKNEDRAGLYVKIIEDELADSMATLANRETLIAGKVAEVKDKLEALEARKVKTDKQELQVAQPL